MVKIPDYDKVQAFGLPRTGVPYVESVIQVNWWTNARPGAIHCSLPYDAKKCEGIRTVLCVRHPAAWLDDFYGWMSDRGLTACGDIGRWLRESFRLRYGGAVFHLATPLQYYVKMYGGWLDACPEMVVVNVERLDDQLLDVERRLGLARRREGLIAGQGIFDLLGPAWKAEREAKYLLPDMAAMRPELAAACGQIPPALMVSLGYEAVDA